jgi:MobA-like NTP transferase domain
MQSGGQDEAGRQTTGQWDAVVLGGGDPGDEFARAHGVGVKPQIELLGVPMALYVLRALRDSGRVRRVAYVGPVPAGGEALIDLRVTDHGTLLSNLEGGIEALGADAGALGTEPSVSSATRPRVLVVTADIPMLTPQMLREVLDAAPEVGLVYPIVRREVCEASYPGVRRTYARLKDGSFTGGNLFMLDPGLVGEFLPRLRQVLAARKQPLRLAGLIGPGVLLSLVLGRLSIAALEARVSTLLGVQARALITPHAAVGTDVDKDDDLTLAAQALARQPAGGRAGP